MREIRQGCLRYHRDARPSLKGEPVVSMRVYVYTCVCALGANIPVVAVTRSSLTKTNNTRRARECIRFMQIFMKFS